MYVKNLRELKKALRNNQSSIKVKDKAFRAIIIKSAMKKGRLYSFDDQKINSNAHLPGMIPAVIAESTNTTLSLAKLFSLFSFFSLYRRYKTKVVINKDGTLSIENEDFPETKAKVEKY
mgnify:CR=1 FL=1